MPLDPTGVLNDQEFRDAVDAARGRIDRMSENIAAGRDVYSSVGGTSAQEILGQRAYDRTVGPAPAGGVTSANGPGARAPMGGPATPSGPQYGPRQGWSAWDYNKNMFGELLKGNFRGLVDIWKEGVGRYPGPRAEQRDPNEQQGRDILDRAGLGFQQPLPPGQTKPGQPGVPGQPGLPGVPGEPVLPPFPGPSDPQVADFMDPRYEWIYDPRLGVTTRKPRATPPKPWWWRYLMGKQ